MVAAAVSRNDVVQFEDGDGYDFSTKILQRDRDCMDKSIDSTRHTVSEQAVFAKTDARVLLRQVQLLNDYRSLYLSVDVYPTDNYQVLAAFGGPRIVPITLPEHHVKTLLANLSVLCEAMQRGELYTWKDGSFPLRSSRTLTPNCARLLRDQNCVRFKLTDLLYMMAILRKVQDQKCLAQADVMAFAFAAQGTIEVVVPLGTNSGLIPYGQLFEALKLRVIQNQCC